MLTGLGKKCATVDALIALIYDGHKIKATAIQCAVLIGAIQY